MDVGLIKHTILECVCSFLVMKLTVIIKNQYAYKSVEFYRLQNVQKT